MRKHLDAHFTVAIMNRRAIEGDLLTPLKMEQEFDDIAAVARALDGDLAVLGHSSGALCAIGAAPLIPRLRNLLLYEPPLERGPHYRVALEKLQQFLIAGDVDAVYDAWLREYLRIPEAVAEQAKASPIGVAMRPFAQYLPREMAAHLAWTFDPESLCDVTAKTTYLVGSKTAEDNLELRGFIPLLEQALPDFTVRELPRQGHFANFFAPELLAEAIIESIDT
jgi:pimeloyl-ACP methyl ester carboxylesterase